MKIPGIPPVAGLGLALAAAPLAATQIAARCDQRNAICGSQAPDAADHHQEHLVRVLNTDTRHYVDTGSGSEPGTADFDALLYPEFIGQELRPYIAAGTQEGPDLW